MPCQYTETPEEIKVAKNKANRAIIAPYKRELDKVTRLLCWLMACYYRSSRVEFSNSIGTNQELLDWYKLHRQKDEVADKEAARQQALAKLNRQDRDALDLLCAPLQH